MTMCGPLSQTEHLLQVLNKKNKSNIYMPLFCYMCDLPIIPQRLLLALTYVRNIYSNDQDL